MTVALQIDIIGGARVQRILNRLSKFDTDDLLDNIGNVVANQTRRRILSGDEKSPDGTKWAALSKKYARYKTRKKGSAVSMLQFDGELRDRITHVVRGDEVEVGSDADHAAAQQFGYKKGNLPARPFLGLSKDDEDEVHEAVEDWIAATMGIRV